MIVTIRELSVLLLLVYSPHYSPVYFLVISPCSFVNERYSSLEMLEYLELVVRVFGRFDCGSCGFVYLSTLHAIRIYTIYM